MSLADELRLVRNYWASDQSCAEILDRAIAIAEAVERLPEPEAYYLREVGPGEQAMNDIEQAIERLGEVKSVRCGNEFSNFHAADLNDCRAEVVELMQWLCEDREFCGACDALVPAHEDWCPLAALAAKILEGEKS